MGAIVTVPVKSVPVGGAKHMVIDGQQRLTTVAILLAAIRNAAADDDNATPGIIGDLLTNRHYEEPDHLKLVPTQVDRAAFKALVKGGDLAAYEETRIIQAYRFFEKRLQGNDDDDQPVNPPQVLQAVQQSLQVVMINLGAKDDPYLIFESLNHKGKPLDQSDLVRNYVLMRFQHSTDAGGEQEKAYEQLWRPMEDELGASMTEFMRHYGMRNGRNVRKGDVYSASKAEFEKLSDVEEVKVRLKDMKEAARVYRRFLDPTKESGGIGRSLGGFQDLDTTVFYPFLLRIFRNADRETMSMEEVEACLLILESYFVRRLICGVPTNQLNKTTLELCLSAPDDKVEDWLREKLRAFSAGRRWPRDEEFAHSLVSQNLYPRRRAARYVLQALEDSFQHKEPVDSSTATIEHVMPQTLSSEWRSALGDSAEAHHERWSDTLGNLTLTGYNSELSNAPFAEKKEKLANTHFELTRPVLGCDTWGPKEIEERGQKLAKVAVARWQG